MATRMLQVTLPGDEDLDSLFEDTLVITVLEDFRHEGRQVVQLAVPAEETEALMDALEERFGERDDFRLLLLAVEAILPRPPEEDEEDREEGDGGAGEEEPEKTPYRISREELYTDVSDGLGASPAFLAMAGLSALVAAVGLLQDDVAVIIGAMVIAPLLQPNVALALAATLGDLSLAGRALKANVAGVGVALVLAWGTGYLVTVDPETPAIASRTSIGLPNLVLAFSAGAAGTLAFTRGLAGAVIGVMVAVALLPPFVAFGVLLGAGHLESAVGALLLAGGNMICINLAGISTFLLQGVRPRTWWQARRARKATLVAVAIWTLLLASLATILLLSGEGSGPLGRLLPGG